MKLLLRLFTQLPLALLSPLLVVLSFLVLIITDFAWWLAGRRRLPNDTQPDTSAASVVIPNWNGRDLLEKYLPSVVTAMAGNPANEIIVVDNGSTDGSAEYLKQNFPTVKTLSLPVNRGFGGGSNHGFREARNDIVVLLNSDMRVAPDFLQPLLDGFSDERVFAVACQIFFSDPGKVREETGLTQASWRRGGLAVRHRIDETVDRPFPCFYGGGGSCAFDRRKFLELGGFDELLRPFYLEDTDLGYLAWKRGWKVLYQPKSHVWHEHRGTIGKKFPQAYIAGVLKKNFLLFCWKNIHTPGWLLAHFFYSLSGALLSYLGGDSPERSSVAGIARAFLQLPGAALSRWRARSLAVIDDAEAFRRPLGGYFRDRFEPIQSNPERLSVLFVSPYPVCPPVHGGGVFMNQTVRVLGRITDLHLIAVVDEPWEIAAHDEIRDVCATMEFVMRKQGRPAGAGSVLPYAVREIADPDLEWVIHRQMLLQQVDVVQLEYTNTAQFAGPTRQIPFILFEHDVYFQSLGRSFQQSRGIGTLYEYLRALRYEIRMLPKMDRIQTCSTENKEYILSFLPNLRARMDDHVRAGIDTTRYPFRSSGREPRTMLFLGSFRHLPNRAALDWFLAHVMPRVHAAEPRARLVIVGAEAPAAHTIPQFHGAVELAGYVEDVREPLARYAVFVCPILSGSGVRVKLLEAFAAGIPVVSTRIGAEGLGTTDGEVAALADDPETFAHHILALFHDPAGAAAMACRARDYVTRYRDMTVITHELERTYRKALADKLRN